MPDSSSKEKPLSARISPRDPGPSTDPGSLAAAGEKIRAEPSPASPTESLSARVLRQVLRTPAFRQVAALLAADAGPTTARDLVTALLEEDPEVWMGLSATSPARLNDLVSALVALGTRLGALPQPLLDAFLRELGEEIDQEGLLTLPPTWAPLLARVTPRVLGPTIRALAAGVGSLASLGAEGEQAVAEAWAQALDPAAVAAALDAAADLAIRVHEIRQGKTPSPAIAAPRDPGRYDPTRQAKARSPVEEQMAAVLEAADLGRLRLGATAIAAETRQALEALLGPVLDDPVAVANLVASVAPITSELLLLGATLVERLDLPDEVLASGVFNLLGALDPRALARLTNGMARTLTRLHQGNLILGGAEPALGPLLAERLDAVLEHLDVDALCQAAEALGEDTAVVSRVIAARLTADPELASRLARLGARSAELALDAALAASRELHHLAPEAWASLWTSLSDISPESRAEAVRLGLDAAEAVAAELTRARRDDVGLGNALPASERARARRLAGRLAFPLAGALAREAWDRVREDPEAIGHAINGALGALDTWLTTEPDGWAELLRRALRPVDRRLLGRVGRHARARARQVLRRGAPGRALPLLARSARHLGRVADRGRMAIRGKGRAPRGRDPAGRGPNPKGPEKKA